MVSFDRREKSPCPTPSSDATPPNTAQYQPKLELREVKMRDDSSACSLIIPVKLHGLQVNAIVDTAAQVTVVNKDVWKQLEGTPPSCETVILKGAATDSHMEAKVVREVQVQIGNTKHKWTLHVANISDPFILGLDFMREKGCEVNMKTDTVTIGKESIASTLQRNAHGEDFQVSRVVLGRRTVVAPHTMKPTLAHMAPIRCQDFVLNPDPDHKGLVIPYGVVQGGSTVPVFLRNDTDRYITLKKGHLIGKAVEMHSILDMGIDEADKAKGEAPVGEKHIRSASPAGDAPWVQVGPTLAPTDSPRECSQSARQLRSIEVTPVPEHLQDLLERSRTHLDEEQNHAL